jgi:CMP-N,N'-diacetyllegionaminic acid synthase
VTSGSLPSTPEPHDPAAIAIITARGGSKRLPGKNILPLAGKPLLAWAIDAAREAARVRYVLVSTDDPQIAAVAREHGAMVPWLRPEELSGDTTPSIDVLVHAARWALTDLDPAPEIGLLLEPTAPLRRPDHLDRAVEALAGSDADSVVSVAEVPHVLNPAELVVVHEGELRPFESGRTLATRRLRGQQDPAYVVDGLVYAFRLAALVEQRSLFGRKTLPLVTDWDTFHDIDTREDFELAEYKLRRLRALPPASESAAS